MLWYNLILLGHSSSVTLNQSQWLYSASSASVLPVKFIRNGCQSFGIRSFTTMSAFLSASILLASFQSGPGIYSLEFFFRNLMSLKSYSSWLVFTCGIPFRAGWQSCSATWCSHQASEADVLIGYICMTEHHRWSFEPQSPFLHLISVLNHRNQENHTHFHDTVFSSQISLRGETNLLA